MPSLGWSSKTFVGLKNVYKADYFLTSFGCGIHKDSFMAYLKTQNSNFPPPKARIVGLEFEDEALLPLHYHNLCVIISQKFII